MTTTTDGPRARVRDAGRAAIENRTFRIPPIGLEAILDVPAGASALVVFAHGSGSSRLSPRNTYVATALRKAQLGTLLFDLLTGGEARDRANVFDIDLLAARLLLVTRFIADHAETRGLRIGYFGASTGAAAALVAAAQAPEEIDAIVSRGGRPDLAGASLLKVKAPTLLIVGGDDVGVIALNRAAMAQLKCEAALEIVPGAGHLFEEPGTLDTVIALARTWFSNHLPAGSQT